MSFDRLNRKLEGLEQASRKGTVVKDVFRVICIPEIWQLAYANIYSNQGAITEGIDGDTFDGMSFERIDKLVESLRNDTYRPKPVRRTYIPKRDGNKRPLGVPSGDDKLAQAVCKIVLQQIYEPVFSDKSHGFRPEKSCHTALEQVQKTWKGVSFLVEFDIKGGFDNINHERLIELLERKIDDKRFIKLIRRFLKAGYIEDWEYCQTYSGAPQGGIISPILSNIYLHELDMFVEELQRTFDKGVKRPVNPNYRYLQNKARNLKHKLDRTGHLTRSEVSELKALKKETLETSPTVKDTSKFKRLKYCRYADDFVCGVVGTYKDAQAIVESIGGFLGKDLKLELSLEKTGIKRANKGINFLSYEISTSKGRVRKSKLRNGAHRTMRQGTGVIKLTVPHHVVKEFNNAHSYGDYQAMKPLQRANLLTSSIPEIVSVYNAELRGLANYYGLAQDMKYKLHKLSTMSRLSLFKTIANKLKTRVTSVFKMMRKGKHFAFKTKVQGKEATFRVFQLKDWKRPDECTDTLPLTAHYYKAGTELIRRMNAKECDYCGKPDDAIEVHHIRRMSDLHNKKSLELWEKLMIARNRKTMLLCVECHLLLHQGKLSDTRYSPKA